VLVALGVRVVRQETELAAKRVAGRETRAAEELRRKLTARLETIKNSFAAGPPENPAIVFVARLEQNRIMRLRRRNPMRRSARTGSEVVDQGLGITIPDVNLLTEGASASARHLLAGLAGASGEFCQASGELFQVSWSSVVVPAVQLVGIQRQIVKLLRTGHVF
jgi:hypothetical protein